MKKKISVSLALTILFVSLTVCFVVTMLLSTRLFENKIESVNAKEAVYDKISDIDAMVRQNYYSTINNDDILDSLSSGYINGLGDSESRYLTSAEYTHYQDILSGKIYGVGISIIKSKEDSGYMKVYQVYDNSPASERGIEKGDLIISIDGVSTINMTQEAAENSILGLAGESVTIEYQREGANNSVVLSNRSYDTPSLVYSKEKNSGYIKISGFQRKTASELEYAVTSLLGQDIKSFVIDLRENSSQDFDSAAEAADILLADGTTMYAVYKDGERKVLYTSDKAGVTLPIIVITNGRTGYAAEMFACMLKDCAGAKIVGTTTMGKGSLQKIFRLSDGSGIELTIAVLSPVSSRSYNGSGIVPDYEKILEDDLAQRFYNLSITEDTQIQRALDVADNVVAGTEPRIEEPQTEGEAEGNEGEETEESNSEETSSSKEEDSSEE
ncbi:MAG: PDZ domain-containing protein [Oscillospiraceae bacterium]|nr:PDZ domain-containing protein [Oscillospiraceae bacterium]